MNNNNTFYILHLNIFTALFDNDVFAQKQYLKISEIHAILFS